MGKIYESKEDYDRAAEEEFRIKCEEIAYYQGDIERTTLDGEWTESELKDCLWDTAHKYLHGEKDKTGWLAFNLGRAIKDTSLLKEEFIVEDICSRYDLIEIYNKLLDMHRNDENKLFGIAYFDEISKKEVAKLLKNNLITK